MGFRDMNRCGRHTPNRNPLRTIVDRVQVKVGDGDDGGGVYVIKEQLECGHLQYPVQDFAGETNAVRRRCWQCGKAATEGGE